MTKSVSKKMTGMDFLDVLPGLLPKINALALHYAANAERDDLVQEGLIALYECMGGFDAARGIPFDAYAMTCIRRRMISTLRKNSTVYSIDTEDWQRLPDLVSTAPAPEDYALGKESVEYLRFVLKNHLSPLEKQVLSLHIDGLSYREIAQRLGRNEKSIDNALSRIRIKIAKRLGAA